MDEMRKEGRGKERGRDGEGRKDES